MTEYRKRTVRGLKIRTSDLNDIPAIIELQNKVYSSAYAPRDLFDSRIFEMQIKAFPEGQILAELNGEIVGYTSTLIVSLADNTFYTHGEITGNGTYTTHDPQGDTLYGSDMAVDPDHRGQGIARKLYEERKKLLRRYHLRRMVAGGRIPGYRDYAGEYTPEQYVEKVVKGEINDPTLTPQLKVGYEVTDIFMDYSHDAASLNYATFLEFKNPNYNPSRSRISQAPLRKPVRKARVCAAQYMMRPISTIDEFVRQIDFFVDTAEEYHSHYLLFPEFFTAQLFSVIAPELGDQEAMAKLGGFLDQYIEIFKERAKKTGIYIIAGSTPVITPKGIKNTAHLFTPLGEVHEQDKLHVTPSERKYFNMIPGDGIKVFDTGIARIGIQICYDVEFPEVSRLMTFRGMEILFVPFSTELRKAYLRVRYSAQARAVENWLYTVLAGNVGNLPEVKSFLLNYGQAAVLTPSDHPFPNEAVMGQAEPNTETVVIADLDLSDLQRQREYGSVRPLRDRRLDIYEVNSRVPVEIVRVF